MQKRIFKTITIICLITLFSLCFFSNNSLATEDENITSSVENEVTSDNSVSNETTEDDTQNDVSSTSADENTVTNNTSTASNTSSEAQTQRINSYSTVSTLPEANLGLNNILNVILIAIGIIIILLAIAILIRLK